MFAINMTFHYIIEVSYTEVNNCQCNKVISKITKFSNNRFNNSTEESL